MNEITNLLLRHLAPFLQAVRTGSLDFLSRRPRLSELDFFSRTSVVDCRKKVAFLSHDADCLFRAWYVSEVIKALYVYCLGQELDFIWSGF